MMGAEHLAKECDRSMNANYKKIIDNDLCIDLSWETNFMA